jgi:chromosome segregation ATPase
MTTSDYEQEELYSHNKRDAGENGFTHIEEDNASFENSSMTSIRAGQASLQAEISDTEQPPYVRERAIYDSEASSVSQIREAEAALHTREGAILKAEESSMAKIREAEAALAAKERAIEEKVADAEQALQAREIAIHDAEARIKEAEASFQRMITVSHNKHKRAMLEDEQRNQSNIREAEAELAARLADAEQALQAREIAIHDAEARSVMEIRAVEAALAAKERALEEKVTDAD